MFAACSKVSLNPATHRSERVLMHKWEPETTNSQLIGTNDFVPHNVFYLPILYLIYIAWLTISQAASLDLEVRSIKAVSDQVRGCSLWTNTSLRLQKRTPFTIFSQKQAPMKCVCLVSRGRDMTGRYGVDWRDMHDIAYGKPHKNYVITCSVRMRKSLPHNGSSEWFKVHVRES